MIKPTRANTDITLSGYPIFSIHIPAIQCVGGWCACTRCKANSIQQIPVRLAGYSIFISYPTNLRAHVAKNNRVRRDRSDSFLKAVPIVHLLFAIGSFSVGSIPPQFPD